VAKRFKLSEILENIPIPVFVIDKRHRVRYWNKACEEFTGYKKEKIIGTEDHWKPFFSKKMPLLADIVLDGVEGIRQSKKIRKVEGSDDTYELELYLPDLKRWIYLRASTLKSDDEVIGAIEIIQDITERKRMEEEIRNLSELYRLVGEAVNQSGSIEEIASELVGNLRKVLDFDVGEILVYDSNTKNLKAVKRVGFEDLQVGENPSSRLLVEECTRNVAVIAALRGEPVYIPNMKENEFTRNFRDVCIKYDLNEMYSVPLISKGELQGVIQLIVKSGKKLDERDRRLIDTISEQMAAAIAKIRAEEKVRESERKYRELFEFSMDAILLTDMDGNILEANNAVEKLFGYTREELKKINFTELYVDPEDRKKLMKELEEKGFFKNYEVKYRRKDGLIVYCLESAVLLKDESGRIVGCHKVIKDITERKRIEKRLRRVNKLLRVASEINQLVVHEKDERNLLRKACKTLANIEDYDAVWVGLLERNRIVPIQVMGKIDKDELEMYLNNFSGFYCVRDAIETQTPSLVSPREDKYGNCPVHVRGMFVQTFVLPIMHGKKIYGVMTFHSSLPDTFDREETNILLDLVDDIGFAIRSIEIERERREALKQIRENIEVFEYLADKLRNPLTIIKGFLEIRDDVGIERTLEVISKEIDRIQEILDELREKEKETFKLERKGL